MLFTEAVLPRAVGQRGGAASATAIPSRGLSGGPCYHVPMGHAQPLLCHRCGAELAPGKSNFYVVRIEAFADPTPPTISKEELESAGLSEEIEQIIEEMEGMTERELMDGVYRKLTIHLCGRCYRMWIENPAG
jgi:hypothetical protein